MVRGDLNGLLCACYFERITCNISTVRALLYSIHTLGQGQCSAFPAALSGFNSKLYKLFCSGRLCFVSVQIVIVAILILNSKFESLCFAECRAADCLDNFQVAVFICFGGVFEDSLTDLSADSGICRRIIRGRVEIFVIFCCFCDSYDVSARRRISCILDHCIVYGTILCILIRRFRFRDPVNAETVIELIDINNDRRTIVLIIVQSLLSVGPGKLYPLAVDIVLKCKFELLGSCRCKAVNGLLGAQRTCVIVLHALADAMEFSRCMCESAGCDDISARRTVDFHRGSFRGNKEHTGRYAYGNIRAVHNVPYEMSGDKIIGLVSGITCRNRAF